MTDYSKMSDFEINKAVAIKVGLKSYYDNGEYSLDGESVVTRGPKCLGRWNPCKEAYQAWSIILDNGISIMKDNGLHLWCATYSAYWADGGEWQIAGEVMDANPLRAAMTVFLMMKEPQNDS